MTSLSAQNNLWGQKGRAKAFICHLSQPKVSDIIDITPEILPNSGIYGTRHTALQMPNYVVPWGKINNVTFWIGLKQKIVPFETLKY